MVKPRIEKRVKSLTGSVVLPKGTPPWMIRAMAERGVQVFVHPDDARRLWELEVEEDRGSSSD